MDYHLAAVRVFVSDWLRALEFYSETLEMPVAYASDEYGWAELDTGEAHLAIERVRPDDAGDRILVGRFVGVSLHVDDIHAMHTQLTAKGVQFTQPPTPQPWGGTLAHFRDPDGNILSLVGAT